MQTVHSSCRVHTGKGPRCVPLTVKRCTLNSCRRHKERMGQIQRRIVIEGCSDRPSMEVLWTLQQGRCWDTGRGLGKRIALGHAPKTLSYLPNCDCIESMNSSNHKGDLNLTTPLTQPIHPWTRTAIHNRSRAMLPAAGTGSRERQGERREGTHDLGVFDARADDLEAHFAVLADAVEPVRRHVRGIVRARVFEVVVNQLRGQTNPHKCHVS